MEYSKRYSPENNKRKFYGYKHFNITDLSKDLYIYKVKFIHNGISDLFLSDTSLIPPEIELTEELQRIRFILSVGAFERKKGHDLLIKAFLQVRRAGSNMSLVIIGQSAPELENTERLIESLGLTEFVYIYQNVLPEKLIQFYDAAELFVSSSRYEPFGLVLVEAGARRLPVIATRTMGAVEIIENNLSGILVPTENSEAIAIAIRYLLDNPEKGHLLSENLRNRVLSHFRWKHAWSEYENLIEN